MFFWTSISNLSRDQSKHQCLFYSSKQVQDWNIIRTWPATSSTLTSLKKENKQFHKSAIANEHTWTKTEIENTFNPCSIVWLLLCEVLLRSYHVSQLPSPSFPVLLWKHSLSLYMVQRPFPTLCTSFKTTVNHVTSLVVHTQNHPTQKWLLKAT